MPGLDSAAVISGSAIALLLLMLFGISGARSVSRVFRWDERESLE